jgi:hypothetical protein
MLDSARKPIPTETQERQSSPTARSQAIRQVWKSTNAESTKSNAPTDGIETLITQLKIDGSIGLFGAAELGRIPHVPHTGIEVDEDKIEAFWHSWQIEESLFAKEPEHGRSHTG